MNQYFTNIADGKTNKSYLSSQQHQLRYLLKMLRASVSFNEYRSVVQDCNYLGTVDKAVGFVRFVLKEHGIDHNG